MADRLKNQSGYNYIATYGSEYNDALYALAAIESRFRSESHIRYGNTLTNVPFADRAFDVIVANPPYGTKWTGYANEIRYDQKGQFPGGLPATDDGQMLFMQHILWQLSATGIAVEVHNGSTLFTGSAGSGESNIRKYIFDHDWVEAIIQMPQYEFFNTGIYTYLWIMNKNKSEDRRGKVALIDGSNGWSPLRKSKGDKRREMLEEHRQAIVDALVNFTENDICKIYDREYFYHNKQALKLYDTNNAGDSLYYSLCKEGAAYNFVPTSLTIDGVAFTKFKALDADEVCELQNAWDACQAFTLIDHDGTTYTLDAEDNSVIKIDAQGNAHNLGCGKIVLKIGAPSKKTGLANAKIYAEPISYTDYEIIPHYFDEGINTTNIVQFMDEYVYKPYEFGKNVVGVEVNFNKEFYVPEQLESTENLLKELEEIGAQIKPVSL